MPRRLACANARNALRAATAIGPKNGCRAPRSRRCCSCASHRSGYATPGLPVPGPGTRLPGQRAPPDPRGPPHRPRHRPARWPVGALRRRRLAAGTPGAAGTSRPGGQGPGLAVAPTAAALRAALHRRTALCRHRQPTRHRPAAGAQARAVAALAAERRLFLPATFHKTDAAAFIPDKRVEARATGPCPTSTCPFKESPMADPRL